MNVIQANPLPSFDSAEFFQMVAEWSERAHWVRAALAAAAAEVDSNDPQQRNTGLRLVNCAEHLAAELANNLDRLAGEGV